MPSPIVTATMQATGLSAASNIIAQFIAAYREERPFILDFGQIIRFLILTILTAPPNYHWQQFLERSFPAYVPVSNTSSSEVELKAMEEAERPRPISDEEKAAGLQHKFSKRNTITKWFVDCMTMGAIMNTVAFLVLMGLLKGQHYSQISQNVRTETIPIIVAGYKMWPIASIVSFTFIPVNRRIVFLSAVGLVWGIYMSLVAARV